VWRLFDCILIEAFGLESTIEYLAKFNLIRCFTIGLRKHTENRYAIKAGLCFSL
jgi:hypothetical protein